MKYFTKEMREVLTINFFIQMGTGERLAKDVCNTLNSEHIRYVMTKESNTYRFDIDGVDFDVTEIRYEERAVKISVYAVTPHTKRVVQLLIAQAEKYYFDTDKNRVIYSYRRMFNRTLKNQLDEHFEEAEKEIFNIQVRETYRLIKDVQSKQVKYTEWINFSASFEKGHLTFLSVFIQYLFAEKEKFVSQVYSKIGDIA